MPSAAVLSAPPAAASAFSLATAVKAGGSQGSQRMRMKSSGARLAGSESGTAAGANMRVINVDARCGW